MPVNAQGVSFPKSRRSLPIAERFARFFEKRGPDECWVWMGCRGRKGYGQIRVDGKMEKAHRVALPLDGRPPARGMEVLHSCDNPACVNPRHLREGSFLENQYEAWTRDRKQGVRKLSPQDVLAIRASGEKQAVLAKRFGVCQPEISRIQRRKRGHAILWMLPESGEGAPCR